MQRITNKEYDMVSELIRDFLEEMEFAPFGELPTAKNIVKTLVDSYIHFAKKHLKKQMYALVHLLFHILS